MVVEVEVVVVPWTRLRHQQLLRRLCGAEHATYLCRAKDAARVTRQYMKKMCTMDGRGGKGRR